MSLIKLDFYSSSLGMDQSVHVMLPDRGEGGPDTPLAPGDTYPVLYLLHGTSHDFSSWARFTGIERYAYDRKIAVVMPSAQLSAYADMVYGENFFQYVAYEVPDIARRLFPISKKREDTFIAGLSMGGYGSAKIALSLPGNYAAVASLSSGNHAYMRTIGLPARNPEDTFPISMLDQRHKLSWGLDPGETPIGTENDLYVLAGRNLENGGPLPQIFHTVGTYDRNLAQARHMRDFFTGLAGNPYHYTYFEDPYGEHTWLYWDKWIQTVLAWLPVKNAPSQWPI